MMLWPVRQAVRQWGPACRWPLLGLILLSGLLAGCAPLPPLEPFEPQSSQEAPGEPPWLASIRGDGPGSPDLIDTSALQRVSDLPKSRQGNAPSYEVFGVRYEVMSSAAGYREQGMASWYGRKFHGNLTANGETYDMHAMTAAHKSLPLPTFVRVTNLDNRISIVVRVNDRGPFVDDRIIDLSYAAAVKLGMDEVGTAPVLVEALSTHPATDDAADVFVQAGAFRQRDNAEALRARISDALRDPVEVATSRSSEVFLVRVGPLSSQDEAASVVSALDALGIEAFSTRETP